MTKAKPNSSGAVDGVDARLESALRQLHSEELSGVVRYLHYAHMILGANRIPIVEWLRAQATESMQHAWQIGEKMTALGLHPDMRVIPVPETGKHNVLDVLREALDFERKALNDYHALRALIVAVRPDDVALEDWVRGFISVETAHIEEAEKMLRTM